MRVTVRLNGTETNPYEKLGLRHNPFPAIPKAEYGGANVLLADLEARPIVDLADLHERIKMCSPEFISGCLIRYRQGEMVSFDIEFPD